MEEKVRKKPTTQAEVVARHSKEDPPVRCETVSYVSGGETLDIDVYRPDPERFPGIRPGVLFFFGGGFHIGTKLAFREQAKICASQGYVAMCAEYRIGSVHGVTSRECLLDGARAWRFVRENGASWSLDPDRIVISGGSAGGTVAAMCGPLTGVQPKGLVLFNPGILDRQEPEALLPKLLDWELDGIETPSTTSRKDDMPPTLVLHGEKDAVISVDTIRRYVEDAKKQGVNIRLEVYPNVGHTFYGFHRSRGHFLLTMGEMLLFMENLFAAD